MSRVVYVVVAATRMCQIHGKRGGRKEQEARGIYYQQIEYARGAVGSIVGVVVVCRTYKRGTRGTHRRATGNLHMQGRPSRTHARTGESYACKDGRVVAFYALNKAQSLPSTYTPSATRAKIIHAPPPCLQRPPQKDSASAAAIRIAKYVPSPII